MSELIEKLIFKLKPKKEAIQEAIDGLESYLERIFAENVEEEYLEMRKEFGLALKSSDIAYSKESILFYLESFMFGNYSVEVRFTFSEKKSELELGYYSLIWNEKWEVIDDFFVIK